MTLKEALRSRRFWWMYAACVFAAPAMFIPFAHVSAAARDLGIGDARAVGLVGLIGIGSIVGRFAIGGFADRLGRIASIVVLEASLGACYLLWLVAGGYFALAVFALWLGLSYGGIVSLMPAICMDLFGARAVSSILGTLYSGAAFGNLLGPVVAGAVFDRTGSYVPVIWACLVLRRSPRSPPPNSCATPPEVSCAIEGLRRSPPLPLGGRGAKRGGSNPVSARAISGP